VKQREWARGLGKKSIQDKQFYDNAIKLATEKSKQVDVYNQEDIDADLQGLEQFATSPLMERQQFTPTLKMKEKPYDIVGAIKKGIDIGYFDETKLDEEGKGTATKSVKTDALLDQSSALIKADTKLYNEGLKKGLWTNEDEAAKWVSNYKLWQADTSVKDIFRSTASDNVFGSGFNETQVNEDFQKWKADVFAGNENAAAYLFGVKLPSSEMLKRTKLLPSRGQQTAGAIYEYETEFNATTTDGSKVRQIGKFEFAPQSMNEQELYKMYLQSLKDRKRTYSMELDKKSSGTTFKQENPTKTEVKKPKPY
jgi:hypothetical protein